MDEVVKYLLTPAAQVALIIELAEIVKRLGLKKEFIPIFDLVLGLISGVCVYGIFLHYGAVQGVLIGVFIGLSACGLFSAVKNVKEGITDEGN